MKLSVLSAVIAGAGLLQVSANPLRVIVVSHEASMVDSTSEPVAQMHPSVPEHASLTVITPHAKNGTGCAGGSRARFRMRQKAAEVSNIFRWAVGLPPVEVPKPHHWKHNIHKHHHHKEQDDDSSEMEFEMMEDGEGHVHHKHHHKHHEHEERVQGEERKHHFHHKGGKFHGHHFGHGPSFLQRLHMSLMQLGVWEGRAVAFVLGCGLGALLRMIWVLTLVSYRAFRGDSEFEETHYIPVLNQQDAEEIFVAPPVYIIDEKAPVREALVAEAKDDESA